MEKLRFRKPEISNDWLRFTALEFTYWFAISFGNYLTVFLQAKGFSASAIGVINAVLSALTIAVTPAWGMVSDKLRSVKKVFIVGMIIGNVAFMFIPAVSGISGITLPALLLYMCFVYAFKNPSNSLLDNWLVRYSSERKLNYGSIRCFGSVSFALAGLIIAAPISSYGTAWTFIGCPVMLIPAILVILKTDDCVPAPRAVQSKNEDLDVGRLFKNFRYTSFLIFAFLVYIVCNGICVFMPYMLTSIGEAGSRYGLISAYTALLEVPMLLAAAPLRKHFPLYLLCIGSALFFGIDGLLLGLAARSMISIILIETFFGLANGLIIASAANYIYTLTPDDLKATGQSLYISATSLGAIAGNLIGGALIDTIGVKPLYIILGIGGVLSALFLILTIAADKRMRSR